MEQIASENKIVYTRKLQLVTTADKSKDTCEL